MSDTSDRQHLEELLLLAQCGDATDAQLQELNDLLRNSTEMRIAATRFLQLETMLQEGLTTRAAAGLFGLSEPGVEIFSREANDSEHATGLTASSTSEQHTRPSQLTHETMTIRSGGAAGKDRYKAWLLATAVVALAATALSFLVAGRDTDVTRTTRTDASTGNVMGSTALTPFAVLVQTHECVWGGASEYFEGRRLSAGMLELKSGLAEIRFDSGISALVRGPATIDLIGTDQAILQFGSVVVEGASTDISLRLGTPHGEVVDVGTRYSALVSPTQDSTEIHVFDGTVLVHRQDHEDLTIHEGEALKLGVQSVITIPVAPNNFAQKIETNALDDADWLLAHEPFEYDGVSEHDFSGGIGFVGPWKRARHYMAIGNEETAKAEYLDSSLGGRVSKIQSTGGALQLSGGMMFQRELRTPIELNHDGVYYLSFLIRRSSHTLPNYPGIGHWGNLTFGVESEDGFRNVKAERSVRFGMSFQQPDLHDEPRFHPVVCVAPGHRALGLPTVKEGSTYLFVGKILASADGPDQVLLRVYRQRDKIETSEPAAWNAASPMEYGDDVCTHIKLKAVDANPYTFDELRIGKTWRSVLPQVAVPDQVTSSK